MAIWKGYLFIAVQFPLNALFLVLMAVGLPLSLLRARLEGKPLQDVQPFRYLDRVLGTRRYRVRDESVPERLRSDDPQNPPLAPLLMYSDVMPGGFLAIFVFGVGYVLLREESGWRVELVPGQRGHGLALRLFVLAMALLVPASVILPPVLGALLEAA